MISTPYWLRARAARRRPRRPRAVARRRSDRQRRSIDLLGDDAKRAGARQRARRARARAWSGRSSRDRYLQTLRARARRARRSTRARRSARTRATRSPELPEVNLDHLRAHDRRHRDPAARHASPSRATTTGYCLDDNARALLLMTLLEDAGTEDPRLGARARVALPRVRQPRVRRATRGRFRNFMSYARRWTRRVRLGGQPRPRAVGARHRRSDARPIPGGSSLGGELFHAALPAAARRSPARARGRTRCSASTSTCARSRATAASQSVRRELAERLLDLYRRSEHAANGRGSKIASPTATRASRQALIVSGERMDARRDDRRRASRRSSGWCTIQRREDGYFAPIGSNGFYERGGAKAVFDQQPVEACAMVSACLEARAYDRRSALGRARASVPSTGSSAQNHLQQPLYDARTGGCRDGAARRSRQREPGRRIDALVPARAGRNARPTRIAGRDAIPVATAGDRSRTIGMSDA